jgi:hypothetical protein
MGDHEDTVRILEVELGQVEQAFRGLSEEDWRAPTKLRPLDETKPPGRCSSWPATSTSRSG